MFLFSKILPPVFAFLLLSLAKSGTLQCLETPFVVVLGVAQDAGYPQAGCNKTCCQPAWEQPALRRSVSSIAIIDPATSQVWIVDATPNFPEQLHRVQYLLPGNPLKLAGIFLTHAHIGHYTGLMHLGREVSGTRDIPVYAMPRMEAFLKNNGPWNQLVDLKNIEIRRLQADSTVVLNERLRITPIQVPHRDEFSETVGFKIGGPARSLLFIPDIDKWERWERNINALVGEVDYALLDGTFFQNGEIPGRDMSEIPHPFVVESMERFKQLPAMEKAKIRFIHFNHTNPVLLENSEARRAVFQNGFGVAAEGEWFGL